MQPRPSVQAVDEMRWAQLEGLDECGGPDGADGSAGADGGAVPWCTVTVTHHLKQVRRAISATSLGDFSRRIRAFCRPYSPMGGALATVSTASLCVG